MKTLTSTHCIGKYPTRDRPFLEQAIVEAGVSTTVFIKDDPEPDYISLWHRNHRDLTSFWDIYKRLVAERG